jgi:4-diphosphocytidyl-2-C-methyl-D-erythritol kinase
MFTLKAPAKINWFLSVLNKREDGYHDISSLMQGVDLYDSLLFEEDKALNVISDLPDLPVGKNLVFRAAKLLMDEAGVQKGAKITLLKEIPLSAGMGGGSSDAAWTLIGLDRLWKMDLGAERLRQLGAMIGSDVPFFIDAIFAHVTGRGEIVTPLTGAPALDLLLVNPGIPVSTAWAYNARQIGLTKKPIDIKLFCQTLDRKDFDTLRSMLINDLEEVVIDAHPEIGWIKEKLYAQGAAVSAMSGSGSTVFGVFRSSAEALRASGSMKAYWCRVAKTLTHHEDR